MNMNMANESVEKATQNMMLACEEASLAAKSHVDAAMRSASVALEGCSEINQHVSELMQDCVARIVNMSKTLATAKSFQEAATMQADLMRETFDSWIAGTGRISEISARVTKEAFDPITEHANNTMGKIAQRVKAAA